jgi:NTE family protein
LAIMNAAMAQSSTPTLRAWLGERPFALGLSSGFFGFFAHTGVMTVLEDEGLLPMRVSGSSAGALVAGLWAAGVPAARLRDELFTLRREHFWDPSPGLGLLRGRLFRERLLALLPVQTFGACRVPLAISVYDVLSRRTRVVDVGDLAPAIQASCAVPLLFHPIWVGGRPLLDGGIADRSGLSGMPAGERVLYHHLASRSPWRRSGSASLAVPERADLTALVIERLPRVGPFQLEEGPRAFEAARAAAREALGRAIEGGAVHVRPHG